MATGTGDLFFLELGWALLFAAIAGITAVKFKMPPVVVLLFFGMVIGPNILGFVTGPSISMLADFGAILVLFMVGLEFSITKLLANGMRAIFVGFFLVLIVFVIVYETAILLSFDLLTSFYLASLFSVSSTAIIIKILEQRGMINHLEVPFLIAILIIEDIIAVFLLTFLSHMKVGDFTIQAIVGSILLSLAVLTFTYVVLQRVVYRFSQLLFQYQTEDSMALFAFSLGIGMSILAGALGLTPSIGAFLAGSIIASLPNGKDFEDAIKPLSIIFSSFFFLSIGMLIDPVSLFQFGIQSSVLIAVFMVAVAIAASVLVYIVSGSGRSAVFAGIVMLPMGEFSLLIAKESFGIAGPNLVGVAAFGVLVTSVISSFLIQKFDIIYIMLKRMIPQKTLSRIAAAPAYFDNLARAFEPGGRFHEVLAQQTRYVLLDLAYLLAVAIFIFVTRGMLNLPISIASFEFSLALPVYVLVFLFSLIPMYRVAKAVQAIGDAFVTVLIRTTDSLTALDIIKNTVFAMFLLLLAINMPLLVEIMQLPPIFNLFSILFALLGVFFIWGALRGIPTHFEKLGKQVNVFKAKMVAAHPAAMLMVKPHRKRGEAMLHPQGMETPAHYTGTAKYGRLVEAGPLAPGRQIKEHKKKDARPPLSSFFGGGKPKKEKRKPPQYRPKYALEG